MDQAALNNAFVYFKCCELSYMEKAEELSLERLTEHNLHHRHDWTDPDNELQYIILEREHPRELIVAFRGLIDSFAFGDLNPWAKASMVSKNRRQMLMMTDLADVPFSSGRVHTGCLQYFERMQDDLASFFTPEFMQEHEKVPIVCTGFSMGSGLSLLAGLFLLQRATENNIKPQLSVINFASPKPGDHKLVEYAKSKLQTYQTYFVRKDPIASFPGLTGYVNGGDLIVLYPNEAKMVVEGVTPEWLTEHHPYTEEVGHAMVTAETFSVGTMTIKEAALPTWGSLRNAGKYHRMHEIKAILKSNPAPYPATLHATAKHAEGVASGNSVVEVAEVEDSGGFFSFFACPSRPPRRPEDAQFPAESRCICS